MPHQEPEDSPTEKLDFEHALAHLEAIVRELEEGEIGLAQGLARYEAGVQLLRKCYHLLEQAQSRIELLSRVDSEGNAHYVQFDEGALSLEEKAKSRGKRRSRATESTTPPEPRQIDEPPGLF